MELDVNYPTFTCVLPKSDLPSVQKTINVPESIAAPIRQGETIGEVVFSCHGNEVGRVAVSACESSEKISFFGVFRRILAKFLLI